MDSLLLNLIIALMILTLGLKSSEAANDDGYIGCFNENLNNKILPIQKFAQPGQNMRPNRCRNLCTSNNANNTSYRFFALRNTTECWCGNADYAFYGAASESECTLPCIGTNTYCGGYTTSSVFRAVLCDAVCNSHTNLCVDSGVNKEITTCVSCGGFTTGTNCQTCIPGYFGNAVGGTCQPCSCGVGAITSSCNANTGLCSACEDGYYLQGGSCYPCNCGVGALNSTCNMLTGQCPCNPDFADLTCSTCKSGFSLNGTECLDNDECSQGTSNCPSGSPCLNTQGSYSCLCSFGYFWDGQSCQDVNECTVPSHNCSASASCTNLDGGFSCQCLSGFVGDGVVCTDVNECDSQPCGSNASCTNLPGSFSCSCNPGFYGNGSTCQPCACGSGASSSICNSVTGVCSCLPGFTNANCNQCQSGRYGPSCLACSCVRGTCDDLVTGTGTCTCEPGFATPTCNDCSPGFFGPNCAGVCSCGQGTCSQGILGNGSCTCLAGWMNNGSSSCSICKDDHYFSSGQCLPCSSSCKSCSGGASNQCLTCSSSMLLSSGSCVSACPSGKYLNATVCAPCDSTCLQCDGPSSSSCLACPSNRALLGKTCITQCPSNTYNNSGTCAACHSSCASCDGSTNNDCLTCPSSFVLNPFWGKCLSSCPEGMYANPNSICQSCASSCLTCNGTTDSSCLTCVSAKIFFAGQCLDSCPSGYFKNSSSACKKCECNKHSSECDAETGDCRNCNDHTTGTYCNLCQTGFIQTNTSTGFTCSSPTSAAGSSQTVAIGVGVAVAVLIIALIGIAVIVVRSRKTRRIEPISSGKAEIDDYSSSLDLEMACNAFRHPLTGSESGAPTLLNTEIGKELSLPGYLKMSYQEDIRIEKSLAGGGGGSISTGNILNTEMRLKYPSCADRIAIKKIFTHDSLTDEENYQLFHQEVSVMSALSYHPNIARVLFYTEEPNAIVFPLYESDLHRLIHTPSLSYSPSNIRDILIQISMGMQAVHGLEIAHRDIKPANFLLEPNPKAEQDGRFPFTVKITDFGVCYVSHSGVASQKFINIFGVSLKYASPEVFSRMMLKKMEADIAELMKSDVFSFAISAWELITRKHPWENLKAEEIQAKVVGGDRPALAESAHDPLLATLEDLTRLCWNQEHTKRPTFKDVAAKLVRLF